MRVTAGSSHDYDDDEELPPLTPYLVDKALDEVRPYLIADGGNVEVVAVQDGVVMLRLQGACGTCPSSTATMKMGIERSLRVSLFCFEHDTLHEDGCREQHTAASKWLCKSLHPTPTSSMSA